MARSYTAVVYAAKPDEGGFWGTVPEMPGGDSTGETIEELIANLEDAVRAYLAALRAAGNPYPPAPIKKLYVSFP